MCSQRLTDGFEVVSASLEGDENDGQSAPHTLERLGQLQVLSSTVVDLD